MQFPLSPKSDEHHNDAMMARDADWVLELCARDKQRPFFLASARVPMLIVAPGRSKGTISQTPVSQIDLFPTLAELCNVKSPSNLQGQSLVPMLKDPSHAGRGWALTRVTRGGKRQNAKTRTEADGPYFGYSLRTPRWRYTEWDGGAAGKELYDHDNDPRELTNLAEHDEHKATIDELAMSLHNAVASKLPADGKIPELQPGVWAPLLVDP